MSVSHGTFNSEREEPAGSLDGQASAMPARLVLRVDSQGRATVIGGDPDPDADPRAESLPLGLKRIKELHAQGFPLGELKAEFARALAQELKEREAEEWAEWAVGAAEMMLIAGSLASQNAGGLRMWFRSINARLEAIENRLSPADTKARSGSGE